MSVIDTVEFFQVLYPVETEGNTYIWTLPEKRTRSFPCVNALEIAQAARKETEAQQ